MSTAELLIELARQGIRLEASEGRLRYHPRSAASPELIERMQAHKADLLRSAAGDAMSKPNSATPPDASSAAAMRDPPGWLADGIDPAELAPCPACGTLEQWQTAAGNWRCRRCDPPTQAMRWLEHRERILKKTKEKIDAGRKGQYRRS